MAKPLVIFGAGDIAQVAHFYFTHDSDRRVAAFAVDREYRTQEEFCGLPVVAFEDVARLYPPADFDLFVAVSYTKLNALRALKCDEARAMGYALATYLSSRATSWPGVQVGSNCFILEDNTLQPFSRIGDGVTLWSGNHIGHHSEIGDYTFIASHVVISGGVKVRERCFIGVNATVRDHVTIAADCVIGAGALIVQDTAEKGVYTAAPAELSKVPSNRLRKI